MCLRVCAYIHAQKYTHMQIHVDGQNLNVHTHLHEVADNLGLRQKPAAAASAATPGGGTYTGPEHARPAPAASTAASATGFDRYGRPLGGTGAAAVTGDLDLDTINQIIAATSGNGGAPHAPAAPSTPLPAAPAPQPGLAPSALDDDARMAAAIAASLATAPAVTAPTLPGAQLQAQEQAPAPPPVAPPVRSAAGQLEESIVVALVTPSGVRVAPGKDDLAQLCAKAKTLDLPLLLMLFCSKFEDPHVSWQMRLRALYCLEALAKSDDERVKGDSLKLLRGRVALIQSLCDAREKALAEMARKLVAVIRASAEQAGHAREAMLGASAPSAAGFAAATGTMDAGGAASLFAGLSVAGKGAAGGAAGGGGGGGGLEELLSFDPPATVQAPPMDILSQLAAKPEATADDLLMMGPANAGAGTWSHSSGSLMSAGPGGAFGGGAGGLLVGGGIMGSGQNGPGMGMASGMGMGAPVGMSAGPQHLQAHLTPPQPHRPAPSQQQDPFAFLAQK